MNLTPAEVAAFLRVKKGTLDAWRSRGIGPAYMKANGRILYPKTELDEWLQKKRRTGTGNHG